MQPPLLALRVLSGIICCVAGSLSLLVVNDLGAGSLTSVLTRVASEFGYLLVPVAALCLLPGWRGSSAGRVSAVLNAFAVVLLLTPAATAWDLGEQLPTRFADVLGPEIRVRHAYAEAPRTEAFVLSELIRPVDVGLVRHEVRTVPTARADLTVDIYRPKYTHPAIPAVLVIHGETWPGGVAGQLVALDGYLAARDYVVIALDAPLQGGHDVMGAGADVRAIIAYLKQHASELGLDPTRLALLGRSVAGYLSLQAAYVEHDPALRGVIALYTPTDLARWYGTTTPESRARLGAYLGDGADPLTALDAVSPLRYVQAGVPPTLLVHGLRDQVVKADQSEELARQLAAADVQHVLVELPWGTHACDQHFSGPCGQITAYAVERFLDGVMATRHARARIDARPLRERPAPSGMPLLLARSALHSSPDAAAQ